MRTRSIPKRVNFHYLPIFLNRAKLTKIISLSQPPVLLHILLGVLFVYLLFLPHPLVVFSLPWHGCIYEFKDKNYWNCFYSSWLDLCVCSHFHPLYELPNNNDNNNDMKAERYRKEEKYILLPLIHPQGALRMIAILTFFLIIAIANKYC